MQKQNSNNMLLLGASSSSSRRSMDVDFNDVFGGPPRRSSVQDWRSSGNNEEEAMFSRNPWSGLSEKPVFGGEESSSSSSKKKYKSDDFFDDIFRGDESSSSTPRKFSSPLPTRLSSPSESPLSLPPLLSLPTKLSKEMDSPAFLAQSRNSRKNKETANIDFPSSPAASTSRFSVEVFQEQVGLRNDSQSSYRKSSLSKEVSLSSDGSAQVFKFENHESEISYQEDAGSQLTYSSTQFHFSIYKWPSTKVPVMRPLLVENTSISNESGNTDQKLNGHDGSDVFGAELLSGNHNMSEEGKSFQSSKENLLDDLVISEQSDWTESSETYEDVRPAKREPKSRSNIQNIFKKVQDNLRSPSRGKEIKTGPAASTVVIGSFGGLSEKMMPASKKEVLSPKEPLYCLLKEKRSGSSASRTDNQSSGYTEKRTPANELPKTEEAFKVLLKDTTDDFSASGPVKSLNGASAETIHISKKETSKPEEPLFCLLKDDSKRKGNGKNMDKATAKRGTFKSIPTSTTEAGEGKKLKKQSSKRHITTLGEENRASMQDPLAVSEEKPDNKVKGKVKDFIKTFNQEVPSEPLKNVKTRQQDNIITATGTGSKENQASLNTAKVDPKINKTTDIPSRVEQSSNRVAKPQREIKTVSQIYDFTSERKNNSTSFSERIIETVEVDVGNVEDSCENFDCTVKELPQDQNNLPQAAQNSEELQAIDAKIRKWSSGKEGNIRSLLSTLQYVLWPKSGWKPVPLVDIIEGSSVRKAYQKALLCLHPDKLQQKGATPHQKYTAEKVFDMLQEAWTEFNSLGSF